jgi:hypothetical protein
MNIDISFDTGHNVGELVLVKDPNGNPSTIYNIIGCDINLDRPVVYRITDVIVCVVGQKYKYKCRVYRENAPGELVDLFKDAFISEDEIHSTWTSDETEKENRFISISKHY